MDLLKDKVPSVFFKYLRASLGSALIVAIYSIVDMAVVGQYEGANGVAALATVAPIWNIIYSLGLLFGIGGSVLMTTKKAGGYIHQGNQIYTVASVAVAVTALVTWGIIWMCHGDILTFFGADETLLPLAKRYMICVNLSIPLYMVSQFLAAFLRNDNAPLLATTAVFCGGFFNMIGDVFFVFICDMGIYGAGLATSLGQVLTVGLMCTHFISPKCQLKWVRPSGWLKMTGEIVKTGFSSFFMDVSMGILSVSFNRQIMTYFDTCALAVYGVITNVSTLVQSCAYGIGQAAQPLISANLGAHQPKRIQQAFRCSLATAVVFGVVSMVVCLAFPLEITAFFMELTPQVEAIAPGIMRPYFLSFLLLPLNIYGAYYFQAMLKPALSFWVSVLRGLLVSVGLIFLLPALFGADMLWYAMTVTEGIVALLVVWAMVGQGSKIRS